MLNIKMEDDAVPSHRLSSEAAKKKIAKGAVAKAQSSTDVSARAKQLQRKIFVVDLDAEVAEPPEPEMGQVEEHGCDAESRSKKPKKKRGLVRAPTLKLSPVKQSRLPKRKTEAGKG